jgi:hypothetical protein
MLADSDTVENYPQSAVCLHHIIELIPAHKFSNQVDQHHTSHQQENGAFMLSDITSFVGFV